MIDLTGINRKIEVHGMAIQSIIIKNSDMVMNVSGVHMMRTSRQLTWGLVKALKLYCEILQINPVEILVTPYRVRHIHDQKLVLNLSQFSTGFIPPKKSRLLTWGLG